MKKFLSVILTLTMLVTLLPAMNVFAATYNNENVVYEAADVACNPGDTITVELKFKSGFNVLDNCAFEIFYNDSYLTYVENSIATDCSDRWSLKTDNMTVNSSTDVTGATKKIYIPIAAVDDENDALFSANDTLIKLNFTANSDVTAYTETAVTFKLSGDHYFYIEDVSYDSKDIGSKVQIKSSTVKIGTQTQESVEKKITNVKSSDSSINSHKTAYKLIPNKVDGEYALYSYDSNNKYESMDAANAELTKAKTYWMNKGYGDDVLNGASMYAGYPKAEAWSNAYTLAQVSFNYSGTMTSVLNGDSYVFPSSKDQNVTPVKDENENVTGYTNVGLFGENDAYLSFDVNASGTMYYLKRGNIPTTAVETAGYTKSTAGKIGGSEVWAKHYDVTSGTVNVKVPAANLTTEQIKSLVGTDTRVADTTAYVWVFDSDEKDSTKELTSVSYTIDGTAGTTTFVDGTYEYTINHAKNYTGDIDLTFVKKNDKQSVTPTKVTLTNGNGVADITVTAEDGTTQAYKLTFKYEAPQTDKKTITNVNSASAELKNAANLVRLIPTTVANVYTMSYNVGDAANLITTVNNYWKEKGYGDNASAGACIWVGYPLVNGSDKLDLPTTFTAANTIDSVLNGESYIFKKSKNDGVTLDSTKTKVTSAGVYGIDDDYLTFDVNASGTMYIRNTVGSYPEGEKAGFAKVEDGAIAGCSVWAKHIDVTAGQTVTVTVPAFGLDDATLISKLVSTSDVRVRDGVGFVWTFDDTSDAKLDGISCKIGDDTSDVLFSADKTEYEVSTSPYTGNVDLTFKKRNNKQTITGDTSVNLTAGNGTAEFTVTSEDNENSVTYKVTFKCEAYKIVNTTKAKQAGWMFDLSADTVGGEYYAVTEGLQIGTSYKYTDRNQKTSGSSNLNGATYIRTPKNEGPASFGNIEVFDSDGKSGGNIEFTKTTGEGENATVETFTGRIDGAFDNTEGTENKSGFRYATSASKDKDFFKGAYDGTDGKWWATFDVTSDCTVVIGDNIGEGYPNLDKTLWKNNTAYAYNSTAEGTYVRHFKAGDTVEIPNYGLIDAMKNDTKVVYTYYNNAGELTTYETTVSANYINWDDITFAIVWDDKAIESSLKEIKIDGELIDGFAADTLNYTYAIPFGTESVTLSAAVADSIATVTGASGTFKAGDSATIVVTAGDKKTTTTYTVTFTQAADPESLVKLETLAVGGGKVLATYSDKTDEDWGATKTESFATGTKITLKAVADEGAEFLYWKDNNTSRVVSYFNEYSFDIGTDKNVSAMFKTTGSYSVKFMDKNYKVVAEGVSTNDITVPQNPYLLGYTFGGWKIGNDTTSYKAGDVIAANTFTADTEIYAIQTVEETKYEVTFENVKDRTTKEEFTFNSAVTVEPAVAENSKKFSHWERDGKIVSYETKYTFYVANYNTTIKAVFVDESETVDKTAVVTMAEPTIVSGNKISFMMERSVPDGFEVVEAGILIKKDAQTEITLETAGIIKGTSVNHANYGVYNLRKANVATGDTYSAVGYLIYKDAAGEVHTIYSNVVSKALQ